MIRTFIFLAVGTALLLSTSRLQAEGVFTGEYTIDETYVGNGEVQRGLRSERDFDENEALLRFVLTPRVKIGILRLGVEYQRYDFGFGSSAQLPDNLQSVSAVVGLDTQLSDSILIRLEAQPGIYGQDLSSGFNLPFIVGGTYIYNPDVQFIAGASVDVQRKYPIIPAVGVRWKISRQWVLNAVVPTPRLEYELNKNVKLYAGATLKGGSYRVNDNFGSDRGISRLNNAVLSYSEIRTGLGADWKVSEAFSLNLEGGYQPYRDFDFYRANVRYHQDGGAPYGTISLHGAF